MHQKLEVTQLAASAIAGLITDSSLPPEKVKSWIRAQPEEMLSQLSSLIIAELRSKDLLPPETLADDISSIV